MMVKDGKYWDKEIKAYKKGLGLTGKQSDTPIKSTLLHRHLDDIHNEVFSYAVSAYYEFLQNNSQTAEIEGILRQQIKGELGSGNTDEAFRLRDELLKLNK